MMYVHSVETLDVPFEGVDFSAPFHPFTAPEVWFFSNLFSFFEFVPSITSLQIELGT